MNSKREAWGIKVVPKTNPNDDGHAISCRLPEGCLEGIRGFMEIESVFMQQGCIPEGFFMVKYWKQP